jgi:putative flippase GtrA
MITTQPGVSIVEHKGVRQFVKFGIVGATSATINFALTNILHHFLNVGLVWALTIAFVASVVNGFYWNRRWTFKEARGNSAGSQGVRFLVVNIIGWMLTISIVVFIVAYVKSGNAVFVHPAQFKNLVVAIVLNKGRQQFGLMLVNGALAVATVFVAFWNFFANRFWTFRH